MAQSDPMQGAPASYCHSLSPDLAPANAIAVNLAAGSVRRMLGALGTLVVGLGLAMVVAFVVTAGLQALGVLGSGVAAVSGQLTAYVTALAPVTFAVAIVAGVVAMIAFVTEQGTTAVGVAISVTTIPAAAYAGVALASGDARGVASHHVGRTEDIEEAQGPTGVGAEVKGSIISGAKD